MGRKRKAVGRPYGQTQPEELQESSKLKLDSYDDVADSEDEFTAGRDTILLEEGPEAKRRRRVREQDEFLQPSDSEVLGSEGESGIDDDDNDDDGARRSSAEEDDEKDETDNEFAGWGSKKEDYYNADIIETEQDALEEEQEANRLQQKHLQSITEADYGFDETEWLDSTTGKANEDQDEDVVTEVLPQVEITGDMPEGERLKIMRIRYPEFEPLAKDFVSLQSMHDNLRLAAAAAEAVTEHVRNSTATWSGHDTHKSSPISLATLKYQALSGYLGAISMYFVLFTSPSKDSTESKLSMPSAELRDHPVMDSLVRSRKMWEEVREMIVPDVAVVEAETDEIRASSPIEEPPKLNGHATPLAKPARRKRNKAQRAAEAAQAEAQALKEERRRKTEDGLADLSTLLAPKPSKRLKPDISQKTHQAESASDFGDEATLTAHEAAQKAQKKQSLRFYTSQIAQKANRRGAAGRDAGGDADLPYRERLKDRQARLTSEAEKRGNKRGQGAVDLGGESDEDDRRIASEIRGDAPDDDYYDMVSARSQQRKSDKKARAEAYAEAAAAGARVETLEEIGADGKRKISYLIEKNKGLTPRRKKDVRNPRVKKRKKFEEKKKKLATMRPVYKGGEGRGGYGGELTGIKKNLVKSVKL